jgi:hypothetical protein
VFAPGKSPVEVQPEMFDIMLMRKVYLVYVDWERNYLRVVKVTLVVLDSLAFIFHSSKHFWKQLFWFAVSVKQCPDHCPWLILQ